MDYQPKNAIKLNNDIEKINCILKSERVQDYKSCSVNDLIMIMEYLKTQLKNDKNNW